MRPGCRHPRHTFRHANTKRYQIFALQRLAIINTSTGQPVPWPACTLRPKTGWRHALSFSPTHLFAHAPVAPVTPSFPPNSVTGWKGVCLEFLVLYSQFALTTSNYLLWITSDHQFFKQTGLHPQRTASHSPVGTQAPPISFTHCTLHQQRRRIEQPAAAAAPQAATSSLSAPLHSAC